MSHITAALVFEIENGLRELVKTKKVIPISENGKISFIHASHFKLHFKPETQTKLSYEECDKLDGFTFSRKKKQSKQNGTA